MSILSRFGDIMAANINALLDKAEDPAKMVDQTLRNLRESLADVKKETKAVMADELSAKRRLDECQAEIARYTNAATNAVKAGQDNDARILLEKKQSLSAKLTDLQQTYDLAHANATKMRQMHDKLVNDIAELETRKDTIKAKINVAKAQERINKVTDAAGDASDNLAAFDRMEDKADRLLDEAMAHADLSEGPKDEAADLAAKYGGGSSNMSVEDELAAIKASMNQ